MIPAGRARVGHFGDAGRRGLHRGVVAPRWLEARRVEGTAVGPRRDVRLGAVRAGRQGSPDLHLGPVGRPCRGGCSGGTAGCAPGRRRGLPPRSRPGRRRSTGSRPGSSGAGSCPDPRGEPAAGTAAPTRRSARRATRVRAARPRRRGRSRRRSRGRCARGARRRSMVRSRSSSHAAEGGRLRHRGDDVGVDPEHHARRLEAEEQVVERLGGGGGRHGVGGQSERHDRVGLDDRSVRASRDHAAAPTRCGPAPHRSPTAR